MSIEKNLKEIANPNVLLVAVSKGRSLEEIQEAYEGGCRDFGENRIQEALEKIETAPDDIRWHFIGKLQKNKVKKAIGHFALIHSIDTIELARMVSRASEERGVVTNVLLEANTSGEASKSGYTPKEWERLFSEVLALKGIAVRGLMTMAPLAEDETVIRRCFSKLKELQGSLQTLAGDLADLSTLSMGMSRDYQIAIQEGATLIRIGTAIFNEAC